MRHRGQQPAGFIQADLTELAPLLFESEWKADCFVLNFPYDIHWYRDRLAPLLKSPCWAVNVAMSKHDGRTSQDTIDSTIAGLCLALDRCSPWGEGFVIANAATVERLIFNENAPHEALAAHIWARLTIPGNICDEKSEPTADLCPPTSGFRTAVLYFARGHQGGCNRNLNFASPTSDLRPPTSSLLSRVTAACAEIGRQRLSLREGAPVRPFESGHTLETADRWHGIGLEWRTRQGANRPGDQRWNIWLDADGTIKTNLTPFQECAPLKKQQYIKLNDLKGKHPLALILQKAQRKELEKAVFGDVWRVAPAVVEAVQRAMEEYNAQRSPLYPLNKIQRLGYLDDNDDILCNVDLLETFENPQLAEDMHLKPRVIFAAGERYTIRTETLAVKRVGRKMNLTGQLDDVQWEGSELALFIRATAEDSGFNGPNALGQEYLFMEERLRKTDVRLSIQAEGAPSPIIFNLQDLTAHFDIPEVPDVAAQDPAGYQRHLDLLTLIEELVNA